MLCCAGFLSSTDLRYRLVCLLNDSVAFLFVFVFDASDFHLAMTTIMLQAHSMKTIGFTSTLYDYHKVACALYDYHKVASTLYDYHKVVSTFYDDHRVYKHTL